MNKTLSRILVTGATGKIGRLLLTELRSKVVIRAFCRSAEATNLVDDIEIVEGNLNDAVTFERAMQDVDVVFLLWPFLPVEQALPIVEAVARRGKPLVYLSSANADDPVDRASNPISAGHYKIEKLIEASVPEWTIIRPTSFASNALMFWSHQIRNGEKVQWPLLNTRLSVIHDSDIADVIARMLLTRDYRRQRLLITGPKILTPRDQLEALGEALGRRLTVEEVSVPAARIQMVSWGLSEEIADGVLGYWSRKVREPEPLTNTIEQVTGRKARTFITWATEHAGGFR